MVRKAPDPQKRSESARRKVLDAALVLCAEEGYPSLTVEGIAARAGVSKKTIYRWWKSKGDVLLEAVVDLANVNANHADTGDLIEDIVTQLCAVIELLVPHHTSAVTGLIAEALRDDAVATALRERLIEPNVQLFNARMQSSKDRGELPAGADPRLLNDLLHGTIYHRLVFHLGMPDRDELRERVEVVLAGVRAKP